MATDPGSVSERELAEDLQSELFSGAPRSVSEAVEAADEPITVEDAPPDTRWDTEEAPKPPPVAAEPEVEPDVEDTEEDTEEDENVVWAQKRFEETLPPRIAKILRDQDQMISRQGSQTKEAQDLAVHYYEESQALQEQMQQQHQMGMPLSSQEEEWIERAAMTNPLQAARDAAYQNNVPLFNALINRVAEDNAGFAGNIAAQVQMEMAQYAQQQQYAQQAQPEDFQQSLGQTFQRLGIDLAKYGEPMQDKVQELGKHHAFVQAILEGDDQMRELGVQAVYDLVREGRVTKRRIRDESREEQLKREG